MSAEQRREHPHDSQEDLRARLYGEAAAVLDALSAAGHTLAVAESLTGGLLAATVTDVPGASATFRGGVCAYSSDLKVALLDVPDELVRADGVVSASVAEAMARGARARLGATYALSTTGVAGPDPQEGKPPGTVFVAVSGPQGTDTQQLRLRGDRRAIRHTTCLAVLGALRRRLGAPADRSGA
jgi:nicotinamide-nucleotide amidase